MCAPPPKKASGAGHGVSCGDAYSPEIGKLTVRPGVTRGCRTKRAGEGGDVPALARIIAATSFERAATEQELSRIWVLEKVRGLQVTGGVRPGRPVVHLPPRWITGRRSAPARPPLVALRG